MVRSGFCWANWSTCSLVNWPLMEFARLTRFRQGFRAFRAFRQRGHFRGHLNGFGFPFQPGQQRSDHEEEEEDDEQDIECRPAV